MLRRGRRQHHGLQRQWGTRLHAPEHHGQEDDSCARELRRRRDGEPASRSGTPSSPKNATPASRCRPRFSTHCDAATQISGRRAQAAKSPSVPTGVTLVVGSAYSDTASGTCPVGGSCAVGVTDSDNSAIGLNEAVAFASPSFTLKKTAAVLGNYVDAVKATGFPIGDTVLAQECDASALGADHGPRPTATLPRRSRERPGPAAKSSSPRPG